LKPWHSIVATLACLGSSVAAHVEPEPLIGPAADDRTIAFLAEHGLDDVLASIHRKKLAEGTPEEKRDAAESLGKIYAKQLAGENDAEKRKVLESRCKDLLHLMPDVDGFELRVNLAKTTYLKAEEIAERERLRLATDEERAEALRILEQVGPAFKDVANRVHRKHEAVDRQADQAPEDKAEEFREQLADLRRLRSLARYYAGWSDLYTATMTGKTQAAQSALENFGWLLNAQENRAPILDRVPTSLLRYEHVSRAAMGVAMALAAKGTSDEAMRWLDAVQFADGVPPAVIEQVVLRRIGIMASGGQWMQVESLLKDRQAKSADQRNFLAPAAARLVVVQAMEFLAANPTNDLTTRSARSVASIGMAELVAKGDLSQVLDLAKRYGVAILGDIGFIPSYVRAVQGYDQVRDQHKKAGKPDEPPQDPSIVKAYAQIADAFAKAAKESDAEAFGPARARAVLLEGLCRFYASEFAIAADRFEAVSKADAPDDLRRDALWYAVLSLERAVERGKNDLAERRDNASILYITTYPTTENASRLLIRRSATGLLTEERAVEILLGVPATSPTYGLAKRQAAKLLYQVYRRATGRAKDAAAIRFAGVAEQVLNAEAARSLEDVSTPSAKEAASTAVLYARQIADSLLSMTAPDATRAESAITTLERVALLHAIDLKPFEGELGYRRLQAALARGDDAGAAAWVEKLGGESGEYPKAARRLLYRRNLEGWRSSGRPATGRLVVEHGRKVIAQMESEGIKLPDPNLAGVYDAVAEAAAAVATAEKDTALRSVALSLDRDLLAAKIRTEPSLRRYARTSEAAGDTLTALATWRELSSALDAGGVSWCEARYETIRLVSTTDAPGAREALVQHHALYPSWGPEPWGSKFSELAKSLGVDLTPPGGGASKPATGGGGR
jgi:hypothetical protein